VGGAGGCPLSGSFEPDDGELEGRIKAPNVNTSASKQHKSLKRILVDSRNRDVALYPSANNFVQTLPIPIRAVKSVTLTDARIPVVDPAVYLYSVICLPDLSGGDLVNTRESSQFSPGALAVVPMIPISAAAPHAYYTSYPAQKMGGCGGGWRLEFPMGITLSQIRVQIHVYSSPGSSSLLPIAYNVPPYTVIPLNPDDRLFFEKNLYITLEIEHDV
jgi:hypothetical protein